MVDIVADQAERDRLVDDLGSTLFVEAGAGTGKTTAVVSRIVALVAAGRLTMDRLAAITFTVAAAGELRVRIREGLEDAARDAAESEVRARLVRAAAEVDRARIETIHAFCAALLRLHPLEAGLPPDFEPLADLAAAADVRERFRRWFDGLTADGDPVSEAVRWALVLGMRPGKLAELFTAMSENWDLVEGAPWEPRRFGLQRTAREVATSIRSCLALMPRCTSDDDALHVALDGLRTLSERLEAAADENAAAAALVIFEPIRLGSSGNVQNWGSTDTHENACTWIKKTMRTAREQAEHDLNAARSAAMQTLAAALREEVRAYAEERRRRGVVTYQDLLVRARDLVRDNPEVLEALRERWDLIAVDEFQDTDPLQAELAFRLTACDEAGDDTPWHALPLAPGRLTLVGDPKQSIYRFRRADIALYQRAQSSLVAADAKARVRLSVNFRSGQRIIECVNEVFGGRSGLMRTGDGLAESTQAEYVELVAHDPEVPGAVHVFGRAVEGAAAEMWRQEARATAAAVRRIHQDGWTVDEGRARGQRPCGYRDICILMPSRTNLRNIERELEAARIPYRLESGSLIIATQEVRDLLNILRSIDDPSDQVALVAALRTPAYGCSDVELARWQASGGRWSYEHPGDGAEPRVRAALDHLAELRTRRLEMSVPRLIDEVLASRLLRAAAYDDWRPRETRRRYRFVSERSRALARSGRSTLHDAVEYLETLAADPTYDSVAGEEADEDCVRVMTVHAAKGLEFGVVVLTGLGRRLQQRRGKLLADHVSGRVEVRAEEAFCTGGWKELEAREKAMFDAENVRLLYVAMTRARDHLVVSLFRGAEGGEKTDAGRLDPLLGRYPRVDVSDAGRAAISVTTAPPASVAPAVATTVEAHREEEAAWVQRRTQVIAAASGPRTQTATGLAHADAEAGLPPEQTDDVAASRRGRAATSLGRAVHAVLQLVDLDDPAALDVLARAQAEAEGIPDRAADVARLARAAWGSASVRRAAAGRHWREVPMGAAVEGVVLEGFIDLLYEEPDGRLVVVDHKTDAVRGAAVDRRMEQYQVQGGVYALLVQEVTGREVARIEFVFAAAGEVRTISDVAGVVTEVRTALRGPSTVAST